MARTGGLNTLVSDPEVRLNAVEREAGERQRDQARHDQMMQLIEKDAGRSKGKLGKWLLMYMKTCLIGIRQLCIRHSFLVLEILLGQLPILDT